MPSGLTLRRGGLAADGYLLGTQCLDPCSRPQVLCNAHIRENACASPLQCAHTKTKDLKFPGMNTYKKQVVVALLGFGPVPRTPSRPGRPQGGHMQGANHESPGTAYPVDFFPRVASNSLDAEASRPGTGIAVANRGLNADSLKLGSAK